VLYRFTSFELLPKERKNIVLIGNLQLRKPKSGAHKTHQRLLMPFGLFGDENAVWFDKDIVDVTKCMMCIDTNEHIELIM